MTLAELLAISSLIIAPHPTTDGGTYEQAAHAYWHRDTDVQVYKYNEPCRDGVCTVGRAELGGHHMFLNTRVWRRQSLEMRCTFYVHEYGHLLGYEHRDHGVMAPTLGKPIRKCRGFTP